MATNDLLIRISGDTKGFAAAMASVNGQLVQAQKTTEQTTRSFSSMGSSLSGVSAMLGGAFSVGALTSFAQSAVQARAQMDSLERGLTAVMGSGQRATVELEKLKEVAKLPGLGFQEAVRGSINLQAAGFNADTARRALQGFGNALATVGKGKAELDGVITALTQIAAKGKVSAEEINQLAERVPQIREIMRGAFGTANTEALQKMGISAQQFIQKVIGELEKLPKVTGGLQNDLENFSDQWTELMSRMGKIVQPAVSFTLEWLSKLSKGITDAFSNWDELMRLYDKIEQREAAIAGISKRQSFLGLGDFGGKSLDDAKAYLDMVKKIQELEEKTSRARGDRGSSGWNTGITVAGFKPTMAPAASRIHINIIDDTTKALTKKTVSAKEAAAAAKLLGAAMQGPVTEAELMAQNFRDVGKAVHDLQMREQADQVNLAAKAWVNIVERIKEGTYAMEEYRSVVIDTPAFLGPDGLNEALAGADQAAAAQRAKEGLKDLSIQYGTVLRDAKASYKGQSAAMREVSTVLTDMSRDIAKVIMGGGKLKDVFLNAAKSMAEAMLRLVIQGAFVKLGEAIGKSIGDIGSLGKKMSEVFKDLNKALGLSGSSASTESSSSGVSAGGGSGGGGDSIAQWINAASSVINNFQNKRMETTMNAVEWNTRKSSLHLEGILDKVNQHLPGIDDLNRRMNEAGVNGYRVYTTDNQLALAGIVAGGSGGGGAFSTTINFSGAWIGYRDVDTFVDDLVRRIKSRL